MFSGLVSNSNWRAALLLMALRYFFKIFFVYEILVLLYQELPAAQLVSVA